MPYQHYLDKDWTSSLSSQALRMHRVPTSLEDPRTFRYRTFPIAPLPKCPGISGLQNSDGIEELKENIGREMATTITAVEPLGKRRRQ